MVTAGWEPDLWFPLGGELLRTIGRKDRRHQGVSGRILGRLTRGHRLGGMRAMG